MKKGILPQPAVKISNDMEIYDNEILIDVQTLNIDSASFTQIYNQAEKDLAKTEEIIKGIVEERGKHQNPVTGSGGMLIGTIEEIGEGIKDTTDLKVGDKIATLVSLSLTPLRIDNIKEIRPEIDQVDIDGKAILFESGIYAVIPDDLPENFSLNTFIANNIIKPSINPKTTHNTAFPGLFFKFPLFLTTILFSSIAFLISQ